MKPPELAGSGGFDDGAAVAETGGFGVALGFGGLGRAVVAVSRTGGGALADVATGGALAIGSGSADPTALAVDSVSTVDTVDEEGCAIPGADDVDSNGLAVGVAAGAPLPFETTNPITARTAAPPTAAMIPRRPLFFSLVRAFVVPHADDAGTASGPLGSSDAARSVVAMPLTGRPPVMCFGAGVDGAFESRVRFESVVPFGPVVRFASSTCWLSLLERPGFDARASGSLRRRRGRSTPAERMPIVRAAEP